MMRFSEEQHEGLARLCQRYRVRRLALFGSATGREFDRSRSDLDFAVEFEPLNPQQHTENYFGLLEDLERLFQRAIDLVEYGPIRNPYFRQSLEETQVLLYDAA